MSGGSWDYLYGKVDEAADLLRVSKHPLRRAFGSHLRKVAKALHDIEWVDSSDYCEGDERPAIEEVLNDNGNTELTEIIKDAMVIRDALNAAIKPGIAPTYKDIEIFRDPKTGMPTGMAVYYHQAERDF